MTAYQIAAIADYMREDILRKQRYGIMRANEEGRYRGRKKVLSDEDIVAKGASGMGPAAIAKELKISEF